MPLFVLLLSYVISITEQTYGNTESFGKIEDRNDINNVENLSETTNRSELSDALQSRGRFVFYYDTEIFIPTYFAKFSENHVCV